MVGGVGGFLSSAPIRRAAALSSGPVSTTFRTFAGSNGNQAFTQYLAMKITVASGKTLWITDLGCFAGADSSAPGTPIVPPSGVTITVNVRDTSNNILASATFDNSSYGTFDSANRTLMKAITAVSLAGGNDYYIETSGYSSTFQNYNSAVGSPGSTPVDNSITGVSVDTGDYYSTNTPPATPAFSFGGSGVRYGGSTFKGYTV